MRALTPLPLALAGLSILALVSLGTADIALTAAHSSMPIAVRQWTLWIAVGLAIIATIVIATRWAVSHLEQCVAHLTPDQIREICDDPALSETVHGIVAPQLTAYQDYQTIRHLRAVDTE